MYNQWERAQAGWTFSRLIHLLRDPHDTALSVVRNIKSKKTLGAAHRAHTREGQQPPPVFSVAQEEVAARERQIREAQARFTELLVSTTHLVVTYEELTSNRSRSDIPEDVGRRILDFLDVPYRRVVTKLVKTAPEPPRLSGT